MSSYWSPKPMRPDAVNPLFPMVEHATVVKGLSPLQRQRLEDGTPPTRQGASALRPADPALLLRSDLAKGSLVETLEKKKNRYDAPKQDPQEPISGVIKSYLAHTGPPDPDAESKEKMQAMHKSQMSRMQESLERLAKACGANTAKLADEDEALEDAEDEEKALTSVPKTPKVKKDPAETAAANKHKAAFAGGKKQGMGVVSALASPVKTILRAAR